MSCLHFLICPEDFIVSRSLSESLEIVWRFAEIQSKTAGRSAYDASLRLSSLCANECTE